ncbi:MAG TPA: phage holin family protein [Candidatus Limnocylindria bacterium]|nr:phage holin family protein [Candidatus Limnocylindria bacterium]
MLNRVAGRAHDPRGVQLTGDPQADRPTQPVDSPEAAHDEDGAPGLAEQFRRTREAFSGLFSAHMALLRAELGEIFGQVKVMAALAGVVLLLAFLTAILLYVGGFLFVGEWLFGSMGWGLAHGVLFGLGLIVVLGFAIVGVGLRLGLVSFLTAAVLAVGLALLLGSNVAYETARYFAGQLASPFNSPASVALLAGALVFGLLLAIVGWRAGGAGAGVAGLVLGALLGLLLGWLIGGIAWQWPPAVGFAIMIGLILWPILHAALAWPRLDLEEHFGRLKPRQTMAAASETRQWLEEQWQTRRPTLGKS